MKTQTIRSIISISCFIFISVSTYAGQFTWTGNVDTVFTKRLNWNSINSSGGDYPTSNDSMIIGTITSNRPVLDQNRDVFSLRMMTGSQFDLKSNTFTVQNKVVMDAGTLSGGNLVVRGTLAQFNGTNFTSALNVEVDVVELNGGTFGANCIFKINGQEVSTGQGGCTFNGDVTLVCNASSGKWTLAATYGDVFNGVLKVYQCSDSPIYLSTSDTTRYNDNVELNNTGSASIVFGDYDGLSYLATGKTISVGDSGYAANDLYLSLLTQSGSTTQDLTLTGTASLFLKGCSFDAPVTLSAPGVLCAQSAFQDSSIITKTGTDDNYWFGNNDFYGPATIANSGSSAGSDELRLSDTYGNRFYSNATFQSSGKQINVDHKDNTDFYADVAINHSEILFKKSITFKGGDDQMLYGTTGLAFQDVTLDKTSGSVTTDTTMEIKGTFTFTSGYLLTDTMHMLTMTASSSVTGASDASFVGGPVKKVGNSAFEFPVGQNGFYLPLSISAPDNIEDSFECQYFNAGQTCGEYLDSSLSVLSDCNYWKIIRKSGNSEVYVSLSWTNDHCAMTDTSYLNIAIWRELNWSDLGHGTISDNSENVKMTTIYPLSDYGILIFAYNINYIQPETPNQYIVGDGFVENIGQLLGTDSLKHPEVLYYGSAGNTQLFLGDSAWSYMFYSGHDEYLLNIDTNFSHFDSTLTVFIIDSVMRVDMKMFNQNQDYEIIINDTSQGYKNYFLGYLDSSYIHALTYQEITYSNIFDGIDLSFHNGDEFRFNVADPEYLSEIAFYYQGLDSLNIDSLGVLCLFTPIGVKRYEINAYQEVENVWNHLSSNFEIADSLIKIIVEDYESESILISISMINSYLIVNNPQNRLKWSTYYGAGFDNQFHSVKIDNNDNIVVLGHTKSAYFPFYNAMYPVPFTSSINKTDLTITKFLPNRSRMFSTYYGGNGEDWPGSIELDTYGNIGFVGYTTSTNFPPCNQCTPGGFSQTFSGYADGFIVKLDPQGQIRKLSTYFGGGNNDMIFGLAFDSQNNLIVVGKTGSSLPTPSSGNTGFFQPLNGFFDGFIAKFNNANEYLWRTYIGGLLLDQLNNVTVGKNDIFYVNGITSSSATNILCSPCTTNTSSNFPVCGPGGATINSSIQGLDVCISAFNNSNQLIWSTLYGGSQSDWPGTGGGIDCTPNGDIIMVGYTYSDDLPIEHHSNAINAYHDDDLNTSSTTTSELDGFIAMYNPQFDLEWSTYYGGTYSEFFNSVSVNYDGKLYVAGGSNSNDFETQISSTGNFFSNLLNTTGTGAGTANNDGVLVKFNNHYERTYGTFFGGVNAESIWSVSFQSPTWSNLHNVIIVGPTSSNNTSFPLKNILGPLDYYDGNAITPQLPDPQSFIANLYNVSTPLRVISESDSYIPTVSSELNSIYVFPNPSFGDLTISSKIEKIDDIFVYDIRGKLVQSYMNCKNLSKNINLSPLFPGLYLIVVSTFEGEMYRTKLIKQ